MTRMDLVALLAGYLPSANGRIHVSISGDDAVFAAAAAHPKASVECGLVSFGASGDFAYDLARIDLIDGRGELTVTSDFRPAPKRVACGSCGTTHVCGKGAT